MIEVGSIGSEESVFISNWVISEGLNDAKNFETWG